jgi:hypothetical protein
MAKQVEYLIIWNDPSKPHTVSFKWSEVLENAFDYYYSEYIPAWTLNETPFNKAGDIVFIRKKNGKWVGWETIDSNERPDIATLFDLIPDLPKDEEYKSVIREIKKKGIKDPEDYFWENIFSYKHINEIEVKERKYNIEWEA